VQQVAAELQSAVPLAGPAVPLAGLACDLLTLDEPGERALASVMAAALARRRDRGIMTAP
jgi:hypothetical protein